VLAFLADAGPSPGAATATAAPAPQPPPGGCSFQLGFKDLHDLIPDVVGDCTEGEHPDPATGNTVQATSTGLLVYRKDRGWTDFTNGERTWINGPCGLRDRPNGA